MNNISISFGKKIPITKCSIKDNQQNKFVRATVYEIDCQDKSDIDEIRALDDRWDFKDTIICGMERKSTQGDRSSSTFYKLESEDGETLGLCYARNEDESLSVHYIESKRSNKFKYVGQSLLASLGLNAFHDRKNKLIIKNAMSSAYDFYKEICGFKEADFCDLEMDRRGIIEFVRQTEKRTEGKIINFGA